MNREEASFILANIDRRVCDDELNDALEMAIKALEQQPCEDAISRQAVQDYIAKYLSQYLYNDVREAVEVIDEYIGEIPSVNPQSKTGHWIEHPTEEDYSVCSRCGIGCKRMEHGKNADGTKYIDIYSYNFCPYCGARMIEPQESEDKG